MDSLVTRPSIVGMNNPQGNLPLWPDPPGCTGWRMWQMITEVTGCNKRQYLHAVERVNIVEGKVWSAATARANARALQTRLEGRTTLLLGAAVPAALGRPRQPWGSWQLGYFGRYAVIPHPSGLNRWYNEQFNRALAQKILVEVFDEGRRALGLPLLRLGGSDEG